MWEQEIRQEGKREIGELVIKQIKKGKFNEVQNNSRQDKGQTLNKRNTLGRIEWQDTGKED